MTRTAIHDLESDLWALTGPERPVTFSHICGAFGWGDPSEEGDYSKHGCVVVGLQEDKALVVLEEFVGSLEEVGLAAVEFKDRLDLQRFFIDPEPNDYRVRLNSVDGLTQYLPAGLDALGHKKYIRPPEHWPYFRGRKCLVSLPPVREAVLADYESYVTRLTALAAEDHLLIAEWCRKVKLLNREDFARGRKHPLMKALVFAVAGMLHLREEVHSAGERLGNNWYGNRR